MIAFLVNNPLRQFVVKTQEKWLARHLPARAEQKLNSRNIFIFPSRFGWAYIGFIVLLFLMGTNYQNNLVLLLSYLMASLFITAIFHTFANLLGLKLKARKHNQGFVGEQVMLPITLSASHDKFALSFYCPSSEQTSWVAQVNAERPETVQMALALKQRGYVKPERITVESYYAFGLLRTWSKLDFAWKILAVPAPVAYRGLPPIKQAGEQDLSSASTQAGYDDFYQLREYHQGEALSHVSWKHFARGQGMLTKDYRADSGNITWLSLQHIHSGNLEEKLGILVYCVLELGRHGQVFGLDLGSKKIEPNNGEVHIEACLELIACYGL